MSKISAIHKLEQEFLNRGRYCALRPNLEAELDQISLTSPATLTPIFSVDAVEADLRSRRQECSCFRRWTTKIHKTSLHLPFAK